MKGFFRYLVILGLFGSLVFGLTACGGYSAGDVDAEAENDRDAKGKKDDGFPKPPAKIVEAKFKLTDDGTFNVKESEGQVILINLWGVWCLPCIKEMPHLVELQEKYKDKKFQIIGLNVGDADGEEETEENIKVFAKKQKLNYKLGWIDRSVLSAFYEKAGVPAVPISFLINRSGKLVGIFVGGGPESVNPMKKSVEKWVNE